MNKKKTLATIAAMAAFSTMMPISAAHAAPLDLAQPTVTDEAGTINDVFTAPVDTAEVDYTSTYDRATATYTLSATKASTAAADTTLTPTAGWTESTTNPGTFTYDPATQPLTTDGVANLELPNPGSGTIVARPNMEPSAYLDYTFDRNDTNTGWLVTATVKDAYKSTVLLIDDTKTPVGAGWTIDADNDTATTLVTDTPIPVNVVDTKGIVTDNIGTSSDNVALPANTTGVTYTFSKPYNKAAGTFEITAKAAPGYNLVAPAGSAWTRVDANTLTYSTELSDEKEATPVAPTVTNNPGIENDSVVAAPNTEFITYDAPVFNRNTGEYSVTARVTAAHLSDTIIMPSSGWILSNDRLTASYSGTIGTTPVTPVAPIIVDQAGTEQDSVTVPTTAGVDYKLTYDKATGKYTMTATPQAGFVFPANAQTTWTGTLNTDKTVTPVAPVIVDENGTANDSVTVPTTEGVDYKLTYDKTTGKYTMTATPKTGYVFPSGAQTNWTGTLSTTDSTTQFPENPALKTVVPEDIPNINEKPGTVNDVVIAPTTTGITYRVEFDPETGDWELYATAQKGYQLKVLDRSTTAAENTFNYYPEGKEVFINDGTTDTEGTAVEEPVNEDDENTGNGGTVGSNGTTPVANTPNDVIDATGGSTTTTTTDGIVRPINGNNGNNNATTTTTTGNPNTVNSGELDGDVNPTKLAGGLGLLSAGALALFGGMRRRKNS